MGRSKILATEDKVIKLITTSSSYKFVIPTLLGADIGEYIKLEKRDNDIVLHFTKRTDNSIIMKDVPITISFD
jgi:uncharacterized membrane protein YqgA involved in biofilm formation